MNTKLMIKTFLSAGPLLLFLACSNPADNVQEAKVAPSAPKATNAAEAPKPADATAKTFAFGPESSTIDFIGSKVTGSHSGGFRKFAGEFTVVNGQLAGTGNKVVIDTTSVWSDNDRLTGHLKSPDFFNVAQFPTAVFESTAVEQKAGGDATVTGNLTLHGVTKQISFTAKVNTSADQVTVVSEFFINRNDFEMKYPGKADDLIRPQVVLKLNVKATPGKADFSGIGKAAGPQPIVPRGRRWLASGS